MPSRTDDARYNWHGELIWSCFNHRRRRYGNVFVQEPENPLTGMCRWPQAPIRKTHPLHTPNYKWTVQELTYGSGDLVSTPQELKLYIPFVNLTFVKAYKESAELNHKEQGLYTKYSCKKSHQTLQKSSEQFNALNNWIERLTLRKWWT